MPRYEAAMERPGAAVDTALRELVDEHRHRCLWFLRSDSYPSTIAEANRVLVDVVDGADVGMVRGGGGLGLPPEPLQGDRVAEEPIGQELQHD